MATQKDPRAGGGLEDLPTIFYNTQHLWVHQRDLREWQAAIKKNGCTSQWEELRFKDYMFMKAKKN